jgi:hypothetical protein
LRRENVGAIGVFSTKVGSLSLGMAGMRTKKAQDAGGSGLSQMVV